MKRTNRLLKMPCIAVALVAAIWFSFAACKDDNTGGTGGNGGDTHTHTFSTMWSSNATQHWKECTGEGCNAKTETANHSPADGICLTCDYNNTPVSVEMVLIPAGTFTMGSPEDEPYRDSDETQHQVTISKSFYMGKYEVTQEQYQAVTGVNPSYFTTAKGREPSTEETDSKRPVEEVTWYDAVEFCNKLSERKSLTPAYTITRRSPTSGYPITSVAMTVNWDANGYRLPTEAEWEYACRAGTTTAYNTGDTISDNTGWYIYNSNGRTHEVGLKPPNAWGLHDMHGSVSEWCWDRYGDYANVAQTDPRGAASGDSRVTRGSNWNSTARYLRSAYRGSLVPSLRGYTIGFRVVRPQ